MLENEEKRSVESYDLHRGNLYDESNILLYEYYDLRYRDTVGQASSTLEMERKLYECYPLLIDETHKKYKIKKSGEEAVKEISVLIAQEKDKDYDEVKDFLVAMAAIYVEIIINEIGGRIVFNQDRCELIETGITGKGNVWPLLYIAGWWKQCHFKEICILLKEYRAVKGENN